MQPMETLDYLMNWQAARDATITCANYRTAPVVVEIADLRTQLVRETRKFDGGDALQRARTWAKHAIGVQS